MDRLLDQGLERLGLPAGGRESRLLETYLQQISLWNRRVNLVRAEGPELVVRHVLDSLAPAAEIHARAAAGPVADVGSGAGLPGIPLAIVLPEIRFVLVERSTVRAAFLRSSVALLALTNVEVCEADVASLAGTRSFPMILMRAFRPPSQALADVAPILAPGGIVAVYAGRLRVLLEEAERAPAGFRLAEVVRLQVPFLDAERHLAVFERAY